MKVCRVRVFAFCTEAIRQWTTKENTYNAGRAGMLHRVACLGPFARGSSGYHLFLWGRTWPIPMVVVVAKGSEASYSIP